VAADSLIPGTQAASSSGALASHLTSRTRTHDATSSAEHRVIEYLLALGLVDDARLIALASEIISALPDGLDDAVVAEAAITLAQDRFDAFRNEVFGARAGEVHPLWLRAFLAANGDVLFGDVSVAKARVAAFGDPFTGKPPLRLRFEAQSLRTMLFPRWLAGLVLPLVLSAGATVVLLSALAHDGLEPAVVVFVALFAFLSFVGALGLTTALRGFTRTGGAMSEVASGVALPRTALVMPIYHESAEHVFAALLAMREALGKAPDAACLEVFVLSDSRIPERIAEEERAFRRTAASGETTIPIFYRRRARNEHQKAGNLAEFFERFGHRYTYAVVLDADSIMHAETILALVRRMEANPRLGLLQAPLALHGARTPFARTHQFAASVYGPVFMRGLARWAGGHGNYYGHNAIIRVSAFLECCALPKLRGEPPFGGNILSHDFVEAALLCRAGWEVRTATDLGGSYEELPPSVVEYVARDRRWCQGNLQHVRIAMAEGLAPMSRIHMAVGVAAYLVGPIWLAFVALGAVLASVRGAPLVDGGVATALSVFAAAMLLGPRIVGLVDALRDDERRRVHGGGFALTLGVVFEALSSVLLAPILMLHHARIVVSIVLGNAVMWGAQSRRSGTGPMAIVRSELPTTVIGLATAALCATRAPGLLVWLAPVYVPFIFAIPIAVAASSERLGRVLLRLRLHAVPTEIDPDDLLERAASLRAFTAADATARFRDIVLDPVLLAAKIDSLADAHGATSRALLERLMDRALRMGPAALTPHEQALVSNDADALRRLHREGWRRWPVESWSQGRERPQLPPEPRLRAGALDASRGVA
jgi:membrane glycosyltransferase